MKISKRYLAAVSCAILLGCVLFVRIANDAAAVKTQAVDIASIDTSLACLDEAAIEDVRRSGSVDTVLQRCSTELAASLGEDLGTDPETARVILATALAANFAPYGESSAISYEDIRRATHLNCGNTIFLVAHLMGAFNSPTLKSIGFEGGAVGNHAQLLYVAPNGDEFLLDPTTGLVAKTTFDDLLRGIPVASTRIRSFRIKDRTIDSLRNRVYRAIAQGRYKPSDFMFMHETLAEQAKRGSLVNYFTPAGIISRKRLSIDLLEDGV